MCLFAYFLPFSLYPDICCFLNRLIFTVTTLNIAFIAVASSARLLWAAWPCFRYQQVIRGGLQRGLLLLSHHASTASCMQMFFLLTLISHQGHVSAEESPGQGHTDTCRSPVHPGAHSTLAHTLTPGAPLRVHVDSSGKEEAQNHLCVCVWVCA